MGDLPARSWTDPIGHRGGQGGGPALVPRSIVVAFSTAGCTGKSGSGGAPENPSGTVAGGAPPAAVPGTSGPAGKGSSNRGSGSGTTGRNLSAAVNQILGRAHGAARTTYTATYRVRLPNGARATSRLAQRPPKFGFEVVQGRQHDLVVFDGTQMHGCVSSGSGWRCVLTSFDDPTEVANSYPGALLHLVDGLVEAVGREIKAGTSRRTVLGAQVDCATFVSRMENPPPPQVFCVLKDGVLAYASTIDKQVVELTGFRASVDARDLVPPR